QPVLQFARARREFSVCRWPRFVSRGQHGLQNLSSPGNARRWRYGGGLLMRRLLLLTVLVCGCGESIGEGKKEVVPMDKVPPAVLKAAQDKLPDIKFDS